MAVGNPFARNLRPCQLSELVVSDERAPLTYRRNNVPISVLDSHCAVDESVADHTQ